jgi:REP element-mobilizing transposase RayT
MYMLTRRCTQRQFLLRPDPQTNNAFIYCLAEAAARFDIEVILPVAMSNHHHTNLYDRYGNVIEFVEHFHKMLAKCMNAFRGRWENFWSSESVSIVRLVDVADAIDKIVYAATNPVKDGLVERAQDWPGVNGLSALLDRRVLEATRPPFFFREDGPMPASVTLQLTIPPELGESAAVLDVIRERVAAVEARHDAKRMRSGQRVLGRRRVLRQSWRDSPSSQEPRRTLNPRVAARSLWSRLDALSRNREFVEKYREARIAWLEGTPIPFPRGTYWLRRFVGVPVVAENN